jgi:hypothetical protein
MKARGIEITGAQFFGAGMRPIYMQGVRTASARSKKITAWVIFLYQLSYT